MTGPLGPAEPIRPADPVPPEPAGVDPTAPAPVTVRPSVHWPDRTGHPTVDAALAAVATAADTPPAEQLAAYQAAHRSLRETLAGIDEG